MRDEKRRKILIYDDDYYYCEKEGRIMSTNACMYICDIFCAYTHMYYESATRMNYKL